MTAHLKRSLTASVNEQKRLERELSDARSVIVSAREALISAEDKKAYRQLSDYVARMLAK